MARKQKPEAAEQTILVGLHAQLAAEEASVKPQVILFGLLAGQIDAPTRYDAAGWKAYLQTVREVGVKDPVTVVRNPDFGLASAGKDPDAPHLKIKDGRHRALACRQLGLPGVPAIVRLDVDEAGAAALAVVGNLHRAAPVPYEEAVEVAEIVAAREKEGDKRPAAVRYAATRCAMSEATVRGRLKLIDAARLVGEDVARLAGVRLRVEDVEALADLKDAPSAWRDAAVPAAVKAAKAAARAGGHFSPGHACAMAVVEAGLAADLADHGLLQRVGGEANRRALTKALKSVGQVDFFGYTLTPDPEELEAAVAKAEEAWKGRRERAAAFDAEVEQEVAGSADPEAARAEADERLHRERQRARRAVVLERCARVVKGLVAVPPEAEFRAWCRIVQGRGRHLKKEAWEWLVGLGVPEATVAVIADPGLDRDLDESRLRPAWDDAGVRLLVTAGLQAYAELAHPFVVPDAVTVEWTGRTNAELDEEAGEAARAHLAGGGKAVKAVAKQEHSLRRAAAVARAKDLPMNCRYGGCPDRFKTEEERDAHEASCAHANPKGRRHSKPWQSHGEAAAGEPNVNAQEE